ncbi:MAG: ATP synthase F1 subunit epsilon [Deltaproteobacteria bacterium]|nr:ATP synthase F1 subunit epsilon [Deltaproteobacteria bacterium]
MAKAPSDSSALHLQIVTPARVILDTPAAWVNIPGAEGELGILPDHAPVLSTIVSGVLSFETEQGQRDVLAVHDGFFQVDRNRVTILAQAVEAKDQINRERAVKSEEEANRLMGELLAAKEKELDQAGLEDLERKVLRAQTRQALAG